jgi:hypothetical protein
MSRQKPASGTCATQGSRQQRNGPEADFWTTLQTGEPAAPRQELMGARDSGGFRLRKEKIGSEPRDKGRGRSKISTSRKKMGWATRLTSRDGDAGRASVRNSSNQRAAGNTPPRSVLPKSKRWRTPELARRRAQSARRREWGSA